MSDFELDLSTHPNDAYFKAVFSDPQRAAAFFQSHLPQSLAVRIDWNSLTALPTSFVKNSLQQTHSDLLFSARSGGEELLLYLLFEHQTTVDPAMPLRLLGYMQEVWQRHEEERGLPLPPVVPFVLHQGPEKWNRSTHFQDLVKLPQEIAAELLPYLPRFSHALLDLTQFDPAKDEDSEQIQVVLQLMKMARNKEVLQFFEWLADEFTGQTLPGALLRLSLMYGLHVDSRLDAETIYHTLESNPQLKEQTMTIAQQLIAQGKAEGKAEGRVEGAAIGKLQVLQELMGLPVTPGEELSGLSVEELQRRFQDLQSQYQARYKDR